MALQSAITVHHSLSIDTFYIFIGGWVKRKRDFFTSSRVKTLCFCFVLSLVFMTSSNIVANDQILPVCFVLKALGNIIYTDIFALHIDDPVSHPKRQCKAKWYKMCACAQHSLTSHETVCWLNSEIELTTSSTLKLVAHFSSALYLWFKTHKEPKQNSISDHIQCGSL